MGSKMTNPLPNKKPSPPPPPPPRQSKLYLVGRFLPPEKRVNEFNWEVFGIFGDHQLADKVAIEKKGFVMPLLLNVTFPNEVVASGYYLEN